MFQAFTFLYGQLRAGRGAGAEWFPVRVPGRITGLAGRKETEKAESETQA